MLSDEEIMAYLEDLESKLRKRGAISTVELSRKWIAQFPSKPGVYFVWEDGEDNPVYVGETGNIRGRMRDLQDSRHHTLRRSIGEHRFSGEPGYRSASTKRKFPADIEEKVHAWLTGKTTISALPVKLGRKELEERICERCKPKYNKKGQRTGD